MLNSESEFGNKAERQVDLDLIEEVGGAALDGAFIDDIDPALGEEESGEGWEPYVLSETQKRTKATISLRRPGNIKRGYGNREALAVLFGRIERAPSPYEELFSAKEINLLTLLCLGVRTIDLSATLQIDSDSVQRYRLVLMKKFGLQGNTDNYAQLLYLASVNELVTINPEPGISIDDLTDQEKETVKMAAQGVKNAQIGKKLGVTTGRAEVLRKTGINKLRLPGTRFPYTEALLGATYGLLDKASPAEKEQFAQAIRANIDANQEIIESITPVNIDDLRTPQNDYQEVREDGSVQTISTYAPARGYNNGGPVNKSSALASALKNLGGPTRQLDEAEEEALKGYRP